MVYEWQHHLEAAEIKRQPWPVELINEADTQAFATETPWREWVLTAKPAAGAGSGASTVRGSHIARPRGAHPGSPSQDSRSLSAGTLCSPGRGEADRAEGCNSMAKGRGHGPLGASHLQNSLPTLRRP